MKIVTVIGTRPQVIKESVLGPELRKLHDVVLVDTGQHYDPAMSSLLYDELNVTYPDYWLTTPKLDQAIAKITEVLREEKPGAVLVYGDTHSTLAGAVAAYSLLIPVAHVEAGLRSGDRSMPEEINRIVTDQLSRWRLVPDKSSAINLLTENITEGVHVVGDLMEDSVALALPKIQDPAELYTRFGVKPGGFLYATVHRQENRTPEALLEWAGMLSTVATPDVPVILALHPGTRHALSANGVHLSHNVYVEQPQGYLDSLRLTLHAKAVITDSGGVQREADWLGTPCAVLRRDTEWEGTRSVLVGRDISALKRFLLNSSRHPQTAEFGSVGSRIAELLSS